MEMMKTAWHMASPQERAVTVTTALDNSSWTDSRRENHGLCYHACQCLNNSLAEILFKYYKMNYSI